MNIDHVEILSTLGFHEIPPPNTVEYVYYYITYNSCWYCDIITRYFPDFVQIFMTNTPQTREENKAKILRAATTEYKKLKRFVYHVYEKDPPANIHPAKYDYYYYEPNDTNVLTHEDIMSNQFTLNKIYNNITNIREIKGTILTKVCDLETAGDKIPATTENIFVCPVQTPDIFTVENKIKDIETQILTLEKQKKQLATWKYTYYELKDSRQLLNIFERINNLYMRTLQFHPQTIRNMPDEIMSIIRSYVGEEFIENIRQYSITESYFRTPPSTIQAKHIKNSIEDMLKKWRIIDIQSYSKQTFIRYDIDNQSFKWRRRSLRTTSSKSEAINYVLRGTHKHTFYEFQRDIIILSKILSENKANRRRQNKERQSAQTTTAL